MPEPSPDLENLEITFTAASSEPFERYDEKSRQNYFERLVVTPEAVNLARLNGGASILKNHDPDHVLGTILKAWIEDGKLAVRARFRKNDPEAVAVFHDAEDGTLPNVSIGYNPEAMTPSVENGVNFRDVVRWTVFEVSVAVGVPADPTVGFYRSLSINPNSKGQETMGKKSTEQPAVAEEKQDQNPCETCDKNPNRNTDPEETAAPAADPANPPSDQSDASDPSDEEETGENKNEQRSVASLRRSIPTGCVRSLNIPKGTRRMPENRYSIARAIQSLVNPEINAAFERSESDALMRSIGKTPSSRAGIMLSFRDGEFINAASNGSGLVGTDHRADLFIHSLRTRMGVRNATVLSGLTQPIDIPTQTGAVTIGVGALNSSASRTKPTVGKTSLSPKKFSAEVVVGEDLLVQGNPDAIAFVVDDLQAQIARKLDLAILKGISDPAITGVDGTTGVQTQVIASLASTTWANVLSMYGKIADYEIEDGDLEWIGKGTTKAALMGISKDTGSGRFLCEEGKVNGYNFNVCGGLTVEDFYFGCWKNVFIGQWGGLQVKIDDITGISDGSVKIVAKLLADVAITNPASFVKRVASSSN